MPHLLTPVVRGRDSALDVLGEQFDAARKGKGTVTLVEGAAGMGKSRFLREATEMARRLSFRAGSGAAEPGDRVAQLAPVLGALFDGPDPVLDRHALGELNTLELRYWLLQDLHALLERQAMETPVLVCLDDLQWSDSGTVAALLELTPRLATLPIAWIFAFRPQGRSGEFPGALGQLTRDGATRIVLGPLGDDAVAQVAADVMRAEPDAALMKMAATAHGSPFLLSELFAGLVEEGLIRVEAGQAALVGEQLPRRIRETVRERLERMSERARQTARSAASLGRRFSVRDLATMLSVPASWLLEPMAELIDGGVFVESEDSLAFRHDLVREAVRSSLPSSASRALDRQAADVLLARGALPVEVAMQLARSADPGDEVAVVTLTSAAKMLASSDPGVAADLSQRALELAPPGHPLRGQLVAQIALLLHVSGRGSEAKQFAETSVRELLPPEQEAEIRLSIANMYQLFPDDQIEASRLALALDDLPIALRARHLAALTRSMLIAGRADEARERFDEAKSAVNESSDASARFVLTFVEGLLAYVDGKWGSSLELFESALRLPLAAEDYPDERAAQICRSGMLILCDRADEALQLSAEGLAAGQRNRQGWAVHAFEVTLGRQLIQIGRLSDAAATLATRASPDGGDLITGILDVTAMVALGRVALHTGNVREIRRTAAISRALLEQSTPEIRRQAAWLLALQAMARSDSASAREWVDQLGQQGRSPTLPFYSMDVNTEDIHVARIAVAAGDDELAGRVVAATAERASLNPGVRSIAGAAAHARGLAHRSHEDLAAAVECFDGGARPLALASALEDMGIADVDGGVTAHGVEAFHRALVIYTEAGAGWDAARVRNRLRALGIRRRVASADRPDRGWAAMTDSELAVARLVAEGITNREVAERLFLSPHTVGSHLRQVFAKLEINSRVELTRLVLDHESSP